MTEGRPHERTTKVCSRCQRRKLLGAFNRRAVSPDGRDPWCANCRRTYMRQWAAANRDHYNRVHRAYYQEHLANLRDYNREYQRRRRALMRARKWKARTKRAR